MFKKILYGLAILLVLLQFVRPNKNIHEGDQPNNIAKKYQVTAEVDGIMKKACYDCHSNNTVYPWYTNIQPVGLWLNNHVNEGKGELNFDEFLSYSPKKAKHKLEEVVDVVKEGDMPLGSYTLIHKNADLTQEERVALTTWAQATAQTITP